MRVRFTALACAALLGMAAVSPVLAQGTLPNRKTFFTFSEAVQLPGDKTLAPGKYMFKLADTVSGDRYIVQIFSEDGSKMYTTLFTMKTQRTRPPDNAEMAFMETPANMPPAVKVWWYPGDTIGREFIYPRQQALRLARATHTPVLATTSTSAAPESISTAPTEMIADDAGQVASKPSMDQEVAPVTTERTTDMGQTASVGTAGQAPPAPMTARRSLPQTASSMPLVGLLGLLSLGSALSLRTYARGRA